MFHSRNRPDKSQGAEFPDDLIRPLPVSVSTYWISIPGNGGISNPSWSARSMFPSITSRRFSSPSLRVFPSAKNPGASGTLPMTTPFSSVIYSARFSASSTYPSNGKILTLHPDDRAAIYFILWFLFLNTLWFGRKTKKILSRKSPCSLFFKRLLGRALLLRVPPALSGSLRPGPV